MRYIIRYARDQDFPDRDRMSALELENKKYLLEINQYRIERKQYKKHFSELQVGALC